MTTPKNIGFIGAGKVGSALGLYFKNHHLPISGYFSLNFDDAKESSLHTNTKPFTSIQQLVEECDLIWITTNDDSIAQVAKEIATLPIQNIEKKTVAHCSGVHTSRLLQPLSMLGYTTASIHPLLAISDTEKANKMLQKTPFTIEGDKEAIAQFQYFFQQTRNQCVVLEAENKPIYHLAAVMLSNYLVTLYHCSNELFDLSGLNTKTMINFTLPLLESVVDNLKDKDTKEALTGPIKRNDKNTIKKHIETLTNKKPELLTLYKELGQKTAKMIDNNSMMSLFET